MLDARLIVADSYDREAFARMLKSLPDAEELLARGGRLLPHFEALLEDLFASLFKLVIRLRPAAETPASTLVNRRILCAVLEGTGWAELKDETSLDAARSAHAACELARRALKAIKSGEILLEEELLGAQQLAGEEERAERDRAAAEALKGQAPEIAKQLAEQAAESQARADELAKQLQRSVSEVPARFDADLASRANALSEDLTRFEESADSFAHSMGAAGPRSASERLQLAQKLEGNEKLQKLARLAGALRAEARAAKRHKRERAATEVYRVGRGADVGRLLPSELSALRDPRRRRDTLRRFVEEQLMQYDLRGDDHHGRGPMVVCLDGSGSMSGGRELWAKAVAIALLDIARRQRRRTRAIVFSGAESPLASFDLTGRGNLAGRRPVDLEAVTELAECFPGGGTDFEKPLKAALEAVHTSALKGADIVFVTDGEAPISEPFAQEFCEHKKRLDISVFAVLVDDPSRNKAATQSSESSQVARAARELGKVADQLTTVTQLTSQAARGLFRQI